MHFCEGLFADVTISLLMKIGAIMSHIGFRALEPERRICFGATLDAQPGAFNDVRVLLFRDRAFGAPKCLCHPGDVMPLGLCHQTCEHQQFSPLLQRKACEVRPVSLDCTQHAQAGVDIVARECGRRHKSTRFSAKLTVLKRLASASPSFFCARISFTICSAVLGEGGNSASQGCNGVRRSPQRIRCADNVRPPPNAGISTSLPGATRPSSTASTTATGAVAELMLPYFCTVRKTLSALAPARLATASMMRKFA